MLRMSAGFINADLLFLTLIYASIKFNFVTSLKPKEHSSKDKRVVVHFLSLFIVHPPFHFIEMNGNACVTGRRKIHGLTYRK